MIRSGIGYDIHRLKRKRRFLLAGVEIPSMCGELGHSDGDVLAHAVCDAILGACALADVGELFPPSDPSWENADSMQLLDIAFSLVKKAGWKVINIDCVIICETPKVFPYRDAIRNSLAKALEVPVENVFLKGKTAEGLGCIGRGKAVEVLVQCLMEKP